MQASFAGANDNDSCERRHGSQSKNTWQQTLSLSIGLDDVGLQSIRAGGVARQSLLETISRGHEQAYKYHDSDKKTSARCHMSETYKLLL